MSTTGNTHLDPLRICTERQQPLSPALSLHVPEDSSSHKHPLRVQDIMQHDQYRSPDSQS
jgi:hypothetical protein